MLRSKLIHGSKRGPLKQFIVVVVIANYNKLDSQNESIAGARWNTPATIIVNYVCKCLTGPQYPLTGMVLINSYISKNYT